MEYQDRVIISTPEGVDLSLTLAGAGSRFVSALIDLTIQTVIIIALTLAVRLAGAYGPALFAVLSFGVVFAYDVFFEVLASGRTPGKRRNGLRVVRAGGEPVGFVTSAIRNLIRVVDFLPFAYLLGAVCILVTKKNQRLGDLAAGTLIVRERKADRPDERALWTPSGVEGATAWDTSGISNDELAAVTRILERRFEIDTRARNELAHTLAERLRPKIPGVPEDVRGERFLESLVAAKSRGEASLRVR